MPAYYCAIDVAGNQQKTGRTPSQAAVLFACAVAAALLVVAHRQAPQQAWAAPVLTTPSLVQAPLTVAAATPPEGAFRAAEVPQGPSNAAFVAEKPAAQHTQVVAWLGGALFFASAAFTMAYKLLWKEPQVVACAAASGGKEDANLVRKVMNSLEMADIRLLSRGGPMAEVAQSKGIDEVAAAIRADQASRKDLTPKDVILEMQRGNGRFWMGLSERPDMSALERRALIMAQAPKIAILSCADSRVPVELIFDQGLGEIFVVRMAGNILDDHAHGSLEFAVKYLGCKVVMVIGHEGCGAVKGAMNMSAGDIAQEPADLQVVLKKIKGDLDLKDLNGISDGRARDREAIVRNTSTQVKKLQENPLFASRVADGSLLVCGAFYEISSGIVDFFSLDKNGLVVDL